MGAAPVTPAADARVQAEPVAPTAAVEPAASEPAAPREPIDLAALVPSDAVAYFECESLDTFEAMLTRVSNLSGDLPAGDIMATLPLADVGIEPSMVDPLAPIAYALAPVRGLAIPKPFLIVPGKGDAPLAASAGSLATRGIQMREVEGGYFVFEHVTHGAERGGAAVTAGLPEATFKGRIQCEGSIPVLADDLFKIAKLLNETYQLSQPRTHSSKLYNFNAGEWIARLREHESLAFGVSFEADRVEFVGRSFGSGVTENPGRVVSAKALATVAHRASCDEPLSMVYSIDPETAFEQLIDGWHGLMRDSGSEILDTALTRGGVPHAEMAEAVERMLGSFHHAGALSVVLEPAKAHVAFYLSTEEPERAREAVALMLSNCELDSWGFEMALPIRSMSGDTLVEDYSVRFDTRRFDFDARAKMRTSFKTFLGDSTLHVKVATAGREVLVILGGDTAAVNSRVQAFAEASPMDSHAETAFAHLGEAGPSTLTSSAFVVETDLVQLFGQLAGLEAIADGQSVADTYRSVMRSAGDGGAPVAIWSTILGDGYSFGASFELPALRTAFDAFKESGL